jgi:hypothetical protein
MNGLPNFRFAALAAAASIAALSIGCTIIGCTVAVDKNKSGDDKNVKIDTPLGGLHVTSDSITAADIGLPVYPGAQLSTKDDKDGKKSADIHFGFGDWQFRLKVVKYETTDSQDQVLAFYRKALGRYGDVIQCNGHTVVGSPTITREGLTCDDSGESHQVNLDMSQSLKAGSKHHQHIVGIEKGDGPGTVFSLVELDLPITSENGKAESN